MGSKEGRAGGYHEGEDFGPLRFLTDSLQTPNAFLTTLLTGRSILSAEIEAMGDMK
jgi:hypothetical protein